MNVCAPIPNNTRITSRYENISKGMLVIPGVNSSAGAKGWQLTAICEPIVCYKYSFTLILICFLHVNSYKQGDNKALRDYCHQKDFLVLISVRD
jgi:hypothetical protein